MQAALNNLSNINQPISEEMIKVIIEKLSTPKELTGALSNLGILLALTKKAIRFQQFKIVEELIELIITLVSRELESIGVDAQTQKDFEELAIQIFMDAIIHVQFQYDNLNRSTIMNIVRKFMSNLSFGKSLTAISLNLLLEQHYLLISPSGDAVTIHNESSLHSVAEDTINQNGEPEIDEINRVNLEAGEVLPREILVEHFDFTVSNQQTSGLYPAVWNETDRYSEKCFYADYNSALGKAIISHYDPTDPGHTRGDIEYLFQLLEDEDEIILGMVQKAINSGYTSFHYEED